MTKMEFNRRTWPRILAVIIAATCPLRAQETRIVSLTTDGLVTWTNSDTNTSSGIEYLLNLNHVWIPMGPDYTWWNIHPTGALHTVDLAMSNYWDLAGNLSPLPAGLDFDFNRIFFHVVSSSNYLPGKEIINNIRLTNVSTSDLTDVTVGEYRGMTTYWTSNFAVMSPGTGTAYAALGENYPQSSAQLPEASGPKKWFARYTHEGAQRYTEQTVWIWGPTNMNITVSASNDCRLIRYEWLNLERRMPY